MKSDNWLILRGIVGQEVWKFQTIVFNHKNNNYAGNGSIWR